jgi:hypothetical protein
MTARELRAPNRRPTMPSRLSLMFLAFALALAPIARGTTYVRSLSGGAACHPANGGSAAKFIRSNHTLANNNVTAQYVVCEVPLDDISLQVRQISGLVIWLTAGSTGGSVTCTAQTGGHLSGHTRVTSSVARSQDIVANGHDLVSWVNPALVRASDADVVTVSCRLPPGFRVGLIQATHVDS